MKKIVTTLAVITALLMISSQLTAQEKALSFGIKGGVNLSNFRLGGDMKNYKSEMNAGGSFGSFIKYDISPYFAIQSGIDTHYRTSDMKSKQDNSTVKFKYLGMEIPVYAIYQMPIGNGKLFVGAGPFVGFGMNAKLDGKKLFKKDNETGKAPMNRWDYGIGSIAGFDFGKRWQINASYQFGLIDLYKSKSGSMRSQALNVGIVFKY